MIWLGGEWNQPSRTDHYLMQLTAVTAQANAKNPRLIKAERYRLRFGPSTPSSPENQAARAALAKSVWMARVSKAGPRPEGSHGNQKA